MDDLKGDGEIVHHCILKTRYHASQGRRLSNIKTPRSSKFKPYKSNVFKRQLRVQKAHQSHDYHIAGYYVVGSC